MKQATVYMNKIPVGRLCKTESGTYLFAYNQTYLNDDNLLPLSLTLPKQKEVFESEELFPFFYSLLSEGANKKAQCLSQKIDENDNFALLLATANYDTIGNVTFICDEKE